MKHSSGSPSAWKLRREAYQKTQGPVSNPGRPSPTNRKARRERAATRQMDADAKAYSDSLYSESP